MTRAARRLALVCLGVAAPAPCLAWAAAAPTHPAGSTALPRPAAEPQCPAWAADPGARVARVEVRLGELVNEARRARGLAPVETDARVANVARAHAERMASLRTMAHGPEGGTAEDRLRAAGIRDWNAVGENIAMGRSVNYVAQSPGGRGRTVACHDAGTLALEVFRAWYASPGHRGVLLDPAFTHLGSGAAYEPSGESVYVTHNFVHRVTCGYRGAPCCPPPAGVAGGICQRPERCRGGLCLPPGPAETPPG